MKNGNEKRADVDCLCKNYENFRKNYKQLIQDEISQLSKILK